VINGINIADLNASTDGKKEDGNDNMTLTSVLPPKATAMTTPTDWTSACSTAVIRLGFTVP
jgi:hypothetical protein